MTSSTQNWASDNPPITLQLAWKPQYKEGCDTSTDAKENIYLQKSSNNMAKHERVRTE